MMENVERYNQVKNAISQVMSTKEVQNALGNFNTEFRATISTVCKHLDQIVAGRAVCVTKGEKDRVVKNALRLLSIVTTVRLSPRLKNFVKLWIELTENWNMQVGYIENLHIVNNTLAILVDMTTTIENLIKSASQILREFQMVRQISPAGIKVSELFYKTILEKQKNNEPISEYEKERGGDA